MPQAGGLYLQAESEVAAINMVYGAAAAGARVLTSSSSPGISLKSEGLSYIAGADLPCVIINIVRAGPGLGGIQPAQSDYFQATKGGGHGDYNLVVLAPSTIQECVDLTYKAFDIADDYRVPVMIMGDGMLGQMMEPIVFAENPNSAPKEKEWACTSTGNKRKKNVINSLYIEPDYLEKLVLERQKRYDVITAKETRYESFYTGDADIVIVAYGTIARVAMNAVRKAREMGIKAGLIRPVTLWPFPSEIIAETAKTAKKFLAVEMSMGQMVYDVKIAVNGAKPVEFYGRTGGVVPVPQEILDKIIEMNGGGN
jgi:2-oxoglutarate ferredoxin oxidoreductase subunit alpha